MSPWEERELPIVSSVLHPTDFSPASERAFAHALAIALLRRTRLTLLNVSAEPLDERWTGFPAVRSTLERWKLLEPGSPRSAVHAKLGMRVEKVAAHGRAPVDAILDHLEKDPFDLIVLATDGRVGVPRWLKASVAERVARASQASTLFVPRDGRGFVAVESGRLSLDRILVPVGHRPAPGAAVELAARMAQVAGDGNTVIDLLHVGEPTEFPALTLPENPSYRFEGTARPGEIVDVIGEFADRTVPDLVVMVTEGPHGMIEALRGTTTEQVMRRVDCPLLAVPTARVRASGGMK